MLKQPITMQRRYIHTHILCEVVIYTHGIFLLIVHWPRLRLHLPLFTDVLGSKVYGYCSPMCIGRGRSATVCLLKCVPF